MGTANKDGLLRNSPSDLATLWMAAMSDYHKASGLDLNYTKRYYRMEDIMRDRSFQENFEEVSARKRTCRKS